MKMITITPPSNIISIIDILSPYLISSGSAVLCYSTFIDCLIDILLLILITAIYYAYYFSSPYDLIDFKQSFLFSICLVLSYFVNSNFVAEVRIELTIC